MFGKKKNQDKDKKYEEFLKAGGGLSGLYDISDEKTFAFVRKYREFIPKREIYTRDKHGNFVPVYKNKKRW